MMIFLHAETYFHHYELKLIPNKHWNGSKKYVKDYLETAQVLEFCEDGDSAFSLEFSKWIDSLITKMKNIN